MERPFASGLGQEVVVAEEGSVKVTPVAAVPVDFWLPSECCLGVECLFFTSCSLFLFSPQI